MTNPERGMTQMYNSRQRGAINEGKDGSSNASAYLALSCRDADRIGDHKGRHLLLDGDNVRKGDDDLHRR